MKKIVFFSAFVLLVFGVAFFTQNNVVAKSGAEIGQCMGDCASEQGMCIGQCNGDGNCINNCASSHGRCVSRCN